MQMVVYGYYLTLKVYEFMWNQVLSEDQCGSADSIEHAKPNLSEKQRTLSLCELISSE